MTDASLAPLIQTLKGQYRRFHGCAFQGCAPIALFWGLAENLALRLL